MNLLEEAYTRLYPGSQQSLSFCLDYSGHFRGYGGVIKLHVFQKQLSCKISTKWEGVSESIQIGFLQSLIAKLNKTKRSTVEMDLYLQYIRNLSKHAVKYHFEPELSTAFDMVNTQFFDGVMDKPNLRWRNSKNPLGTYEYATDTISISTLLTPHPHLLKYVLYHEMLHKKHGFKQSGLRQCSHGAVFRAEERKFPEWERLEKELTRLVSQHGSLKESFFSRLTKILE
ncbi:M48 family metallopeptidase [Candidatus Woesearchaeota archaeon]|nr:M48 family metallopeptidase [Candidatus Woesearchaeota archaeon]